ncbi:MAG TPA: hypothetical protein VGM29_18985, partial [Polyangiaceae bacterium]
MSPRVLAVLKSTHLRIFVVLFSIYAITSSGGLEVADADVRYETAKSWLDGRGGALASSSENGVLAPNGRRYGFYGPLQSVLMLPTIAIAEHISQRSADVISKSFLGIIAIPCLSALSMVVLFQALLTFGYGECAAFSATCVIAIATPLWFY